MKKILTVVLDGFGLSDNTLGNAIKEANPENILGMFEKYPHSILEASEEAVGLEKGQFGNSEVGHLTIGAGRKVKQSINLVKDFLDNDINDSEMFQNMVIDAIENNKTIHLMGLFSDGKVHSDMNHFIKLYDCLVNNGIKDINFHLISDGRDTKVKDFYKYYTILEEHLKKNNVGVISSICGRYYAMDRDKRWERTEKYYKLVTRGVGMAGSNVAFMLKRCYDENITDEYLPPIKTRNFKPIRNGDILIWMNYRTDRAKQIISSFTVKGFDEFGILDMSRTKVYAFLPIDNKIKTNNFIASNIIENPLGVYLSKLGLSQARVAETEKYAHVTYFFDGESNASLEGCQKFLIPSPKVATYDLKPEMSAVEVTKKVVQCLEKDYDFILVNYANADMVGHTGNLEATRKAVTTIDLCLKLLKEKADENFYTLILTADHGNADMMLDETGGIVTTHTISKVPFIITDEKVKLKEYGDLSNIAPTILEYMDIAIPKEMDAESLIIEK